MGFRFRKRVKVMPGVSLNFSTKGVRCSLGGRGATLNVGKNGMRATVGLPGTGMSYSEKIGSPKKSNPAIENNSDDLDSFVFMQRRNSGSSTTWVIIGCILFLILLIAIIGR